jgi:hypothetical protein
MGIWMDSNSDNSRISVDSLNCIFWISYIRPMEA